MRSTRTASALLMSIVLAVAPSTSSARAHQASSGPCTLRSNSTDSQEIDPSVAAKRGIAVGSDVAMIDVTMTCKGRPGNGTVAADIDATRTDLVGTSEAIVMHIDRQNGYVSYYGAYHHLPGQVVRLEIVATPQGSARHLKLVYQHRFAAR